jgi:homoserine kinase
VIHVRAPATTANLGPGFDCVGVALDLWNELEVGEGDGEPDERHLGVRAFARISPVRGRTFRWTNPIPRARGLGSSAAVIALGLVAGALTEGREPDPEELLRVGVELEGHADNLAAALAGGVCLTWENRIARIADSLPAIPIAVVPDTRISTAASRAALPSSVSHEDAAYTAGRAALLGASLAGGSRELFAAALNDRLHEPYREANVPALARIRNDLPTGALGATLSGSGPTVIVWAENGQADACAADLSKRFHKAKVIKLAVTPEGATVPTSARPPARGTDA